MDIKLSTQAFLPLPHFSLLEITGPDAERFLQGQLTCDVVRLSAGQWTLGACCTAKGRMVANFVIARTAQSFWLRLPKTQVAALQQHLSKYAVFFKAQMHDRSGSHRVFGKLPSALHNQLNTAPAELLQISQDIELHWADGRIERWLPETEVEHSQLANDDWALADIQQGLAWVDESSREAWLPQQIDWHKQGGVSFKKGCYTGQEIVARLEYLGKNKNHLVRITSSTALQAQICTPLHDAQGNALGELIAWQGQQGLALLPLATTQAWLQGQALNLLPLFYNPE